MADQSALATLQDALGAAWDKAKGLTAKDIQTGLDAASLATVAWPIVGDAIGLGADAYRYITQPEERTGANYAMSALGALPFVPSVGAAHAAGAAVPAAIGMLRKGGDESLMPWHQAEGARLLHALEEGRAKGELTSPSIGISKDVIPDQFFHRGGDVMLIPKIGAFDPGAYTSTLFNRDAYTPRAGDYAFRKPGANEGAARLQDKGFFGGMSGKNLRGREDGDINMLDAPVFGKGPAGYELLFQKTGDFQHALAMLDSPVFRTFEQFERSPRGAGLLVSGADASKPAFDAHTQRALEKVYPGWSSHEGLVDALEEYMLLQDRSGGAQEGVRKLFSMPEAELAKEYRNLAYLREYVPEALSGLDKLRGELARAPSNYAELKVHGGAQISPEHFAGALLGIGNSSGDSLRYRLMEALESRGIPTRIIAAGENYDPKWAFEAAHELQQDAGLARKSPL